MDGKKIDVGKQAELPGRSLLRELLELVGEEIAELGNENEIAPMEQILANCTDRQLRVYDETSGDVYAIVDHLADENVGGSKWREEEFNMTTELG